MAHHRAADVERAASVITFQGVRAMGHFEHRAP